VVIKIFKMLQVRAQNMEENVKREITIMKLCNSSQIVRLYEVIETPTDTFVVMEYLAGGELFSYIQKHRRLDENEARRFFHQIIAGIEYCHSHGVAHRDLKPENLLLDENSNIKIADFGLSNIIEQGSLMKTSCGSAHYVAPEVISGNPYSGPGSDVWSSGVILYLMLCGFRPFEDELPSDVLQNINGAFCGDVTMAVFHISTDCSRTNRVSWLVVFRLAFSQVPSDGCYILPSFLSESSKDLVSKILVTDPQRRLSIDGIRSHPWFLQDQRRYLTMEPWVGSPFESLDEAGHEGRRNHGTLACRPVNNTQRELDEPATSARPQEAAVASALTASSSSPFSGVALTLSLSPGTGGGPQGL
jgi:5'-AMP-activated protein kinase, catalytic alpha subunit